MKKEVMKKVNEKLAHYNPKGKGAGKNGKAGKAGKSNVFEGVTLPPGRTPNRKFQDKNICFAYGRGTCCRPDCSNMHVCQLCDKKHPWKECGLIRG